MKIKYKRVFLEKIINKYNNYIELYKQFNNGSIDGATSLSEFYLIFTYYAKYSDREFLGERGY